MLESTVASRAVIAPPQDRDKSNDITLFWENLTFSVPNKDPIEQPKPGQAPDYALADLRGPDALRNAQPFPSTDRNHLQPEIGKRAPV